jgi:hypothetical protein
MNQTIEEKNKELVLKAFDTLFNKRDYAAAERYWSPYYIQHSAHIEPYDGSSESRSDGLIVRPKDRPNPSPSQIIPWRITCSR